MYKLFNKDNFVTLDEASHTYKDRGGLEYTSVSKIYSSIQPDVDWEKIKYNMAWGKLGKGATPEMIKRYVQTLEQEWKEKAKRSTDFGTACHKLIETWDMNFRIDMECLEIMKSINTSITKEKAETMLSVLDKFFRPYGVHYNEELVYSKKYRAAGTIDKPALRSKRGNIIDVFDFKTNIEKGIYFDSIKRDEEGKWSKHYNRYYNEPFSSIECCNYMDYSLQLSIYGAMIEEFDYKIGRLGIISIDSELIPTIIPVSYMKLQAEVLLTKNYLGVYCDKNDNNGIVESDNDW